MKILSIILFALGPAWALGRSILSWAWFAAVQAILLAAEIVGWFVLLPACLLHAWELSPVPSINDGRKIDRWRWRWLAWADNPEDGVSGQTALVWINATTRGPYWPDCPSPDLRAYAWSAWRNSADDLKYALRWRGNHPPYASGTFRALGRVWNYGLGWKLENAVYLVPVLSVKPA